MIRNFPELLEMREKNFPVLFGTACWGKISCTVHDCWGKISCTVQDCWGKISCTVLDCWGKNFLHCPWQLGEDYLCCPIPMIVGKNFPVHDSWEKFPYDLLGISFLNWKKIHLDRHGPFSRLIRSTVSFAKVALLSWMVLQKLLCFLGRCCKSCFAGLCWKSCPKQEQKNVHYICVAMTHFSLMISGG